jgi:hypothetical protein
MILVGLRGVGKTVLLNRKTSRIAFALRALRLMRLAYRWKAAKGEFLRRVSRAKTPWRLRELKGELRETILNE